MPEPQTPILQPNASLTDYLGASPIITSHDAQVRTLAAQLRDQHPNDADFVKAAFEWVRDEISHSGDAGEHRVAVTAHDALVNRTGLCFAKAHLLAALLRSQGIPTGLCYQRLTHGDGFVVHGLVAVYVRGSWHRLDPRGNKAGVDAQFSLDADRVAFSVDESRGELNYPTIYAEPHPAVLEALRSADDALTLLADGLPSELS